MNETDNLTPDWNDIDMPHMSDMNVGYVSIINIYSSAFGSAIFFLLIGFDHDTHSENILTINVSFQLTLKNWCRNWTLGSFDCKNYFHPAHSTWISTWMVHWYLSLDTSYVVCNVQMILSEFTLPVPAARCSDEQAITILQIKKTQQIIQWVIPLLILWFEKKRRS